jgi:hypothetical protein
MYWKSLYGNKIGLIFSDGEKASKQNLFKYLNHILTRKVVCRTADAVEKIITANVK